MNLIITQIRKELKQNIDKTQKDPQYFYKEKVNAYGVRTPLVRIIGKKYFAIIKDLSKKETFDLAKELLKSDYNEDATIAFQFVYAIRKEFEKNDFKFFELWFKKYINNWGKCDDFATHTLGYYIEKFPDSINNFKKWIKSKNRWLRRGVAVSFIIPARKGNDLKEVFFIANGLLKDRDDLVQKGYGWLLKEASRKHQREVFNYIMKNKDKMSRTALRYAIELMPQNLRRKALAK
ncbi:MAG: DNA alkylation repair protein [Candidatus Parcubacteria bacterium]|nr:DNA alkylation repair protein [Candidatus Parcubacteria bacterium]